MTRVHRRRRSALLAGALTLAVLPLVALPGGAVDTAAVHRFAEATTIETAVAISQDRFPGSASTAVLAREDGTGPAAFGSTLAAAGGGPMLISEATSVPAETMTELARLDVATVYLMGDESILEATVAAQLTGEGYEVVRAEDSLQAADAVTGPSGLDSVYLVAEGAQADQVVAGPAAAASGTVALEVPAGILPAGVAAFLDAHDVGRAVMVGEAGGGADAKDLAAELEAVGVDPLPLRGRDPAETSVALLETAFREPEAAVLANPSAAGSSLLGAGLAANAGSPLLYVDVTTPLPPFVEAGLSAHANNLTTLWIVGPTTEVDAAVADAAEAATDPIEPLPLGDVEPGMTGIGLTVIEGIDPVSFDVEVIDVIPNGIAAQLDLILVKTSGPVIEETKGIAAGFSGSPVYVEVGGETKLMGAVSYGCFACDQSIGGVTPAEDMLEVLDYPGPVQAGALHQAAELQAKASVRTTVRGQGAVELRRLELPVSVAGLGQPRFGRLRRDLARSKPALRPTMGSTPGNVQFGPFDPLYPGHSWAGVLSTGTLGFSGIGTTTYRDGDRSLAFGHPFFFQGPAEYGLYAAKVHTVLGDPSQIFGGSKVASVTGAHGTMTQDRMAAVAGVDGAYPHLADLPAQITNLETGKEFSFRGEAVNGELFPDLVAFGLLAGLDRAFDRLGAGTVLLTYTIEGRTKAGAPFAVSRTNRYASDFDATFEAIFEPYFDLWDIMENISTEVSFDAFEVTASVEEDVRLRSISRVRARSSSFKHWTSGKLRARPGDRITVQTFLRKARSDTIMVETKLRAPRRKGRTSLTVRGGGGFFFDDEFYFFEEGGGGGPTLDQVLDRIAKRDRSDQLVVELRRSKPGKVKTLTQDVIQGFKRIRVQVVARR